jgi:uncharacterized protein with beta-barrel porin domain
MVAGQSGPFAALQNGPAVAAGVYAPDVRSGLGMASARRPYGPSPVHAPPSPWSLWAQAVGSRGEIDDDGNAARVDGTLSGFFGDVDGRITGCGA